MNKDVIRKTVSFKRSIVDEINRRRGKLLIDYGEDINFTHMVNIMLEQLFALEKKYHLTK